MGAVIKSEKNKQQVKEEKSYSNRNSKVFSFTFIVQLKRNADRLHYYKPALLNNFSPSCVKKNNCNSKILYLLLFWAAFLSAS